MIIDHIANRATYAGLGDDFMRALDFFAKIGEEPFERENIVIAGTNVVVKARPMMTKPQAACVFEAHHKHADIHFVAYGKERIGYANIKTMQETAYDAQNDVATLKGEGDTALLTRGYFMITFPQDAHMPCIAPSDPAPLGKMIAKIKVIK